MENGRFSYIQDSLKFGYIKNVSISGGDLTVSF